MVASPCNESSCLSGGETSLVAFGDVPAPFPRRTALDRGEEIISQTATRLLEILTSDALAYSGSWGRGRGTPMQVGDGPRDEASQCDEVSPLLVELVQPGVAAFGQDEIKVSQIEKSDKSLLKGGEVLVAL